MRDFERSIRLEAQVVLSNKRLRNKDLREWSSAPIAARVGEVVAHLPEAGVYVAIAREHDKRKPGQDQDQGEAQE